MKLGELEIRPSETIRWLGVYFDRRLNFSRHMEIWGAKAYKVAAHLRSFSKVADGAKPDLVALAAKACVLPVALYGAET